MDLKTAKMVHQPAALGTDHPVIPVIRVQNVLLERFTTEKADVGRINFSGTVRNILIPSSLAAG